MISVCKHCGRSIISATPKFACDKCRDIDEMYFAQIKAYLTTYPNSNAIQVADAIGISPMLVLKYVDEGRVQLVRGDFEQL